MKDQLSELIDDVREQVLYLRELGVESMDVNLPELEAAPATETPVVAARVAGIQPPRLEPVKPAVPGVSRLASLPSLKKRVPVDPGSPLRGIATPGTTGGPAATESSAPEAIPEMTETQGTSGPAEKPAAVPDMPQIPAKPDVSLGLFENTLPEPVETIDDIRADIGNCVRCPLHIGRTQIVHSTGNLRARLMFVGEAPGADEDEQGFPFVGRAGQLLTKIIEGIGLRREDVFIGNINRCRPPGNRQPVPSETAACRPFLLREVAVVRPRVIVVLGNTATQNLLDIKTPISKLRGNFQDYFGVKVMPTFHPAYLLRDPHKKREVWEDMKLVRDYLNSVE